MKSSWKRKASGGGSRPKSTLPKLPGMGRNKEQKAASSSKQKVDNLMKKRFSTAKVDSHTVEGPRRPLPNAGLGPIDEQGPEPPFQLDMGVFERGDYNADEYVDDLIGRADRETIQQVSDQLEQRRRLASLEMERSVNENYNQFVVISKEIRSLDKEMSNLRGLLNELRVVTDSLSRNVDQPALQDTKQGRRSSVADLANIYANQLQTLWRHVEGAQKFLPSVPGRHIIKESPSWVELNTATWKPRQGAHMFLLNDNLLIASRKRRKQEDDTTNRGGVRLMAERCWPLAEIEITGEVDNAITVRMGKESFVYRSEKPSEKTAFMDAFKKAASGLRKAMRAETEEQLRMRDSISYFTSRDPTLRRHADLLKNLSASLTSKEPSVWLDVDGKQKDIRWLEDRVDELDVLLSHREFDDAVRSIERGRALAASLGSGALASELTNLKLNERANQLCNTLCRDIVSDSGKKSLVKQNIDWLLRLDFEDRARESFLAARSKVVKKRTRMVQFHGDVPVYIYLLSFVYFTLIRNTIEIYQVCFTEYQQASAIVAWTNDEVRKYAELFSRQLHSFDVESNIYKESAEATNTNCSMLREVGMDMAFMLQDLLHRDVQNGAQHAS